MSDHELSLVPLRIEPTVEEHRLTYDEQVAEKEYQLERLESELKRFINGHIKKIEKDICRAPAGALQISRI